MAGSPSLTPPRAERASLTVAVTGASGTIGPALLARLDGAEEVGKVLALGRRATREMKASAKTEFHRLDVRDRAGVHAAVKGADVVVHLAFALYGLALGERDLFATNVRGTLNVAEAAAASAARFVLASSAAVYGRGGTAARPLTEDAPLAAPSRLFYARHKAQAELTAREALSGGDTELYVLRPCAIVGPHSAGVIAHRDPRGAGARALAAAAIAARTGLRPVVPAPAVPLQFVHEDDVAQAVVLATLGAAEPATYNLAGEGWLDGREAVRTLGLRPAPLPAVAVRAALHALSAVPPLLPALGWSELVREPVLVDSSRARHGLGWTPRFDSRGALEATRARIGW